SLAEKDRSKNEGEAKADDVDASHRFLLNSQAYLEVEPSRKLEGSRTARAKNWIDPVGRLPKKQSGGGKGGRPGRCWAPATRFKCAAVSGQVRNIKDVEPFTNQHEPDPLGYGDTPRQTEIVCKEAISGGEFVRQDNVGQRTADSIALRAFRNVFQRDVCRRRKGSIVLGHQPPDVIDVEAVAK